MDKTQASVDGIPCKIDGFRRRFAASEQVLAAGDAVEFLFLIEKGCLRVNQLDGLQSRLAGFLNEGELFGHFYLSNPDPSPFEIVAEVDCTLFLVAKNDALQLLERFPEFQYRLGVSFRDRLRKLFSGRPLRRLARSIAFIRPPGMQTEIPGLLADQLQARGERVFRWTTPSSKCVSSDFAECKLAEGIAHDERAGADRILADLSADDLGADSFRWADFDEIFWLYRSDYHQTDLAPLQAMRSAQTELASHKIKRVCLLAHDEQVRPAGIWQAERQHRDFVLPASDVQDRRAFQQGIDRIFRHLCDVKLGIALAGGGAKGLAHLGVLQVLDEAGISFDLASGTSAGALFGLPYFSGYTPAVLIEEYRKSLTPRGFFKLLPKADQLFLLWKFRTRGWDRMLRPYLSDWTFEQLPIPFFAVTVDLVSGRAIPAHTGDMITSMLDSLNLPGIARPICRDGKILVDGGVLNNLPADVLVENGADFVLGVTTGSGPSHQFGKNPSDDKLRVPGALETMFRIIEVMGSGTSEFRKSAADMIIAPAVDDESFSDFSRTEELAAIGREAMSLEVTRLKRMIADLLKFDAK